MDINGPATDSENEYIWWVVPAKGVNSETHMVGKALLGLAMAKQGYLREEQLEPLNRSAYTPGECIICGLTCAIARWHGPNKERPAELPNGDYKINC